MSFAAQQLAARVRSARHLGIASRRRAVPNARAPLLIESDYGARLVAIVDRIRSAARHVVAELPDLLRADDQIVRIDDDPGRRARRLMDRVRSEADGTTNETQLEGLADGVARRVSEHQRGELVRQGRAALGIDIVTHDPKVGSIITGFAHENVTLIKSLQGRVLDDLESMIVRAVTSGTRSDAVQQEVSDRFGVAERHARLIARDQIGKLNGQIATARHQELGLTHFRWRSMRDPKVRPEHRELDGKVFSYASPPAVGLPGRPICCRCLEEPIFDDIHAELVGV